MFTWQTQQAVMAIVLGTSILAAAPVLAKESEYRTYGPANHSQATLVYDSHVSERASGKPSGGHPIDLGRPDGPLLRNGAEAYGAPPVHLPLDVVTPGNIPKQGAGSAGFPLLQW